MMPDLDQPAPPQLEAVVFDMDGVLIDSEPLWQRVRKDFARAVGARWTAEDQHATMGVSTAEWSRIMVERLRLRERAGLEAPAVASEIIARMLGEYRRQLPLRDGAVEAVRAAAAAHTVALATGSPIELAQHVLQASGLRPLMAAVVCGDDVARGKPAPDIYLQALALVGVQPTAAVGVEDSTNGLRALRAAGMAAVAAPHPAYPLDAHTLSHAHGRVDSMRELTLETLARAFRRAHAQRGAAAGAALPAAPGADDPDPHLPPALR